MARPRAEDHKHGTRGGYIQHLQRGTDPCPWCTRAANDWRRAQRQRGKCAAGLGWPLEASRG